VVLSYDEVDVNGVRVKKPLESGPAFATFNVSYGKGNQKLLIQSPSFVVMRDPFVERRVPGKDRLTLLVGGGDRGRARREDCLGRLNALEDRVLAKVMPSYPNLFEGKTRSSSCCLRAEGGASVEARFRHLKAAVRLFDASGEETALDTLMRTHEVVLLLEVSHVWTGTTHYGVDVRPVQVMRVDASIPSTCNLLLPPPPAERETTAVVTPPLLPEKYAKMLKMGIPRQAVDHAMVMDGVSKPSPPPPPRRPPPPPPSRKPPPPPPPSTSAIGKGGGDGRGDPMSAVLSQISERQFKLRSAADQNPTSPPPPVREEKHWTQRLVPTLADILGAKQRLRNAFSRATQHQAPPRIYEPHNTFPFLEDIRSGRFSLRRT